MIIMLKSDRLRKFFNFKSLAMSKAVDTADSSSEEKQSGLFNRFLASVEFLGNIVWPLLFSVVLLIGLD
jgi:hypothetical protein